MRFASLILAAVLLAPAAAVAETELTPYLGYRSSGPDYATGIHCIQAPCASFAGVQEDWLFGGSFRKPINDRWKFELLANRQSADLVTSDTPLSGTQYQSFAPLPRFELRMTNLQAGLVRSWRLRSFSPYAAAGAGVSRFDSGPAAQPGLQPDGDQLSASLAAGLDVPLQGRFGARVESRLYSVDLPARFGGRFVQTELTTGVTIKL